VADVVAELRQGSRDARTVNELARTCGLTRAHFSRRFRALTGETPHALLLGSQIERAKYLLATRRRPLGEVAYETGFSDQSHLSHTFRRLVGMTPGRFRAFHRRIVQTLESTVLQDRM
jgi:AraC family transcriptional regulator